MGKHLDMMETNPGVKREVERIEGELDKLPGNPLGKARANLAAMDCYVKDRKETQQYKDWQANPGDDSFISYMAKQNTPDGQIAKQLQERYEQNRADLYEKALPLAEQGTANPQEAQRRANLAVDDASDTSGNCEALRKGPSAQQDLGRREAHTPTKIPHAKMGG